MPASAQMTIGGAGGLTVSVDPAGSYEVSAPDLGWRFGGDIGSPLSNLAIASSADAVGPYSEITFGFQSDVPRYAAIRSYGSIQAVLFTVSYPTAAANTFCFPNWTRYPQGLNHLTYTGTFSPPSFGDFPEESPWIFFDSSANTFILSPAANFMVASTHWGSNGELASGISSRISAFPQGFQHQTLLVIEKGINRAFDTWGQTLTTLQGKTRPPNDADPSLTKLGYWTDRGATYYYQMAPALSYQQTLNAVKADFDRLGIGLGYMQLDSWFYPKGATGTWNDVGDGIYQYIGSSQLFPYGLSSFQKSLGLPLFTHARWIDPKSPYRSMYQVSGNVIVDRRYWDVTAAYLANSGVATYEQDWLDAKAQTDFNLTDPDAFLDNMAAAMAQRGLTLQYCMATPRYFLQSSKYNNLTTARASNDRFSQDNWTPFVYTSRLASAMGVWPFTDVFMSGETGNLLLATLSAGPVGVGDPIGSLSAANLLLAVRKDGVIVKPDVPLTPIDSNYLNAVNGVDAPLIGTTYSDFGGLRTYYIAAFPQGSNTIASFTPSEIGLDQPVYLYDYFSGRGQVVKPSDAVQAPIANSPLYLIAAPIGPSGIAVLGDLGHFVSMGKKRVSEFDDNRAVTLTVAFAPGEQSRVIYGYAPFKPTVWADSGSIGPLVYNPVTHEFQIPVLPGADGTASIGIRREWRPMRHSAGFTSIPITSTSRRP